MEKFLRLSLQKNYRMKKESPIQNGPPSGLTPILVVNDANSASNFYKKAFDATEIARIPAPDGIKFIHIRLQVFGTIFILMDELLEFSGTGSRFLSPSTLGGTSVTLHLQVDDAFKVWNKAIDEKATSIVKMDKQFWGEYYGRLKDPFGHEWTIAQMIEYLSDNEVGIAASDYFGNQE
jgi:PhnB protein